MTQYNPYYKEPTEQVYYGASKSKIAAGLLAIFLGVFGVHNFYLGRTGRGVAQLLLTILSFGLLSFVTGIWSIIEGILILTSAHGSPWHLDAFGRELRD
jgi:TM2 domain-containing membrane protein YozV